MAMNEPAWNGYPSLSQPKSAEEAVSLKRMLGPGAVYVAGGTWLQTQWESGAQPVPPHIISIDAIDRIKGIYEKIQGEFNQLIIGACTPLTSCIRHPLLAGGPIAQACRQIAAPSVRNRGTIGGNILSATGDVIPALLVMQADLVWQAGQQQEHISLLDWLEQRSKNGAGAKGDMLLLSVQVPPFDESEDSFFFYEKVGRREAFTPSVVTVAACGKLDEGGYLEEIRLAVGGGSCIPHRLPAVEAMLKGVKPDADLWHQVHEHIRREYKAAHDSFASSAYRKQAAANLLLAGLAERMIKEDF